MIPFLDTWRDDNLTLGYDFGPGELVTQGGSIRYVDKPKREGSVLTGVPLIDRGNEKSTEQEVINVPPADSIKDGAVTLRYDLGPGELTTQGGDIGYAGKEPQNEKSLDDVLAYVDTLAPRKPAVPDPEVINIPPAPFSQQEIEMRQAEQALQEEREADKQRGSEGYEAKEDGVFARLKNWGSGVHDYLFGKDNEMDELMDAVDDIEAEKAKEEKGVVGYYGGKLADFMLGPNYGKEWDEIKKEISEKGLLGYIPQKGATLLENMARSPYARFVDPTTVLGGQRRMVNDIDAYQNRRDLTALREDLMKQDMLDNQTLLGQAKQYGNMPPEQRQAVAEYMRLRYPGRTAGSTASIKNEDNMRAALWNDFYNTNGRYPNAEEWNTLKREHGLDKATRNSQPKNLNEYAIRQALDNYERDPERYDYDPNNALAETYDSLSQNPTIQGQLNRQGSYQPKTADEKIDTAQREAFAKTYAPRLSKELEEVESDTYNETLRDLVSFYKFLNDPRNANYLQGPFNNVIQGYASKLGIASAEQEAFLAAFLSAQRNMHAIAIRQINQSGATNREEQRKAAESIIDMSKGLDYNKALVEKTISNMALAQAMKRDEYYLAEAGGNKRSNDALLRKKYGAMIHDPSKYIDPAIISMHLGEDGVFAYSPSVGSYVFGTEE